MRGRHAALEAQVSRDAEDRIDVEDRLEHYSAVIADLETENADLKTQLSRTQAELEEQKNVVPTVNTIPEYPTIDIKSPLLAKTDFPTPDFSKFGGRTASIATERTDSVVSAFGGGKTMNFQTNIANTINKKFQTKKNPLELLKQSRRNGNAEEPDPPTGKVTLVFTDIQGSTNLWEQLSERMHVELEKHNTTMRLQIKEWRGYEVKTQGDSFMAAFGDLTDAACFCLSVQLKLLSCSWDPLLDSISDSKKRAIRDSTGRECTVWNGLRVRMGLHSGIPICQNDVTSGRMDYFGPVVNQAARVQSKGYGGMICITPEMRGMLDLSKIPTHLTPQFEKFGVFSLRGIAEPVELEYMLPTTVLARREDFKAEMEAKSTDTKPPEEDAPAEIPTGRVCFVYIKIEHSDRLLELLGQDLWAPTLVQYQNEVTSHTGVMGGHIMSIDEDRISVSFQHSGVAFKWALELQDALLLVAWNKTIEQIPECATTSHQGRLILKGPRAKIGIHSCECESSFDPITKKAQYFGGHGPLVAAFLCEGAKGGEIYISGTVHQDVVDSTLDVILEGAKDLQVEGCAERFSSYLCFSGRCPQRANYLMEGDVVDVSADVLANHEKVTNAPFGQVALVFTDVQNSTVLWENGEEVMAEAVRIHHQCMRAGIQKFHGYEVKTEGDAFMIAFNNSKDALRWCLCMQDMLLGLDYPDGLLKLEDSKVVTNQNVLIWRGLRVRMGIHTGTPQCETDPVTKRMDYYGQMVNKSARVSGLAQGGQIVISDEVYKEVAKLLPELGSPIVSDGGEVALKGIKRKAKIHFLVPRQLKARNPFKTKTDPVATTTIDKMAKEKPKEAQGPTGRVAISFTDIQNSTVLWEKCSQMQQVVQMHHRIMREGIIRHNGYEVKTEGDAFMVCFSSTKDGLAWCLDMQNRLLACDWHPELLAMKDAKVERNTDSSIFWRGPRVRMGLHIGEKPDLGWEKDDCTGRTDYYGRMVNKAARVSGLGKGGEIVISSDCYDDIATSSTLGDLSPAFPDADQGQELSKVSLGKKKLKGIDQSVDVYSVTLRKFDSRRRTWAEMDAAKQPPTESEAARMFEKYQAELSRREEERSRAPTGRVTLVFTDVQGSTKLWDTDKAAMAEAVQTHHDMMRRLISRMGGYEVKTEGDAFMVAFHSATQACKWCITVQRELMEETWPEGTLANELCTPVFDDDDRHIWHGLRVRMGFHVGDVDSMVDPTSERMDYYGPAVNAAARIGGIGAGGEIVTSLDTVEEIELENCGNPFIEFIDTRTLKGITQQYSVFRVTPRELTARKFASPEQPKSTKTRKDSRKQSMDSDVSEDDEARQDGSGYQKSLSKKLLHMSDSFRKDIAHHKEEIHNLKGKLRLLERADQDKQFEIYRIHKHLRVFMSLIRKYGDCAADRTKGVFSQTDMVHEWIRQHRGIMTQEAPGEIVQKKDKKAAKPNVEIKTQGGLAIESQKEEEAHVTWTNSTYAIATTKLSRSIVGHLSKHFFYVHTNLIQPLAKAALKKEGGESNAMYSRGHQRKSMRRGDAQNDDEGDTGPTLQQLSKRRQSRAPRPPSAHARASLAEGEDMMYLSRPVSRKSLKSSDEGRDSFNYDEMLPNIDPNLAEPTSDLQGDSPAQDSEVREVRGKKKRDALVGDAAVSDAQMLLAKRASRKFRRGARRSREHHILSDAASKLEEARSVQEAD